MTTTSSTPATTTIADPDGQEAPVRIRVDHTEGVGRSILLSQDGGGEIDLNVEQARNLGHALIRKADELTPLTDEDIRLGLVSLRIALTCYNEARGTHWTIVSVAEMCAVDLDGMTRSDLARLARFVGTMYADDHEQ